MVSDPSALLLLKYGIPYHKSSETLHLRSNLGHKLVHGAGGGGVCTCSFCSNCSCFCFNFLLLLMLNLQFNSSFLGLCQLCIKT